MNYIYEEPITKEFILNRISEEDIMEYYLQVSVQLDKLIKSPLRQDRHPTCSFSYHSGRIKFRDWSEPHPWDCFDIVCRKFNIGFYAALEKIARDFSLREKPVNDKVISERERQKTEFTKSSKKNIQVKHQSFTRTDVEYLKSFGITSEQCRKFRCISVQKAWVGEKEYYYYSEKDPCIGYYLGEDSFGNQRWKLYFYKRNKSYEGILPRFIGNTNRINGWVQIPEHGGVLVITKSMKDVMVLDTFGINAIALQNETTLIYSDLVLNLKKRFRRIYSLYDFDRTGIAMANKMKKLYSIYPIFITNGKFGTIDFKAKDISDLVKLRGREYVQNLINYKIEREGIMNVK